MTQDKAPPTPAVAVPSEQDKNYPFYELRFILRVLSHHGGAPEQDWQTAHGMAKAIFERWHKERLATPPSLPAAQAVEGVEAVPPMEPDGRMWSAGRAEFIRWAQRYEDARSAEKASGIADVAGSEIWREMYRAANRALAGGAAK